MTVVMGPTMSFRLLLVAVPIIHDAKLGNRDAVPVRIWRLNREILILTCVGLLSVVVSTRHLLG